MKHVNLSILTLLLVAVYALMSLTASSASALPENLPQVKKVWTGKNDGAEKPRLETLSGTQVSCAKMVSKGEDTSDNEGTFTMDFMECATPSFFNAKCSSRGDGAGTVLAAGKYHFVYDSLTTLGVAILLELGEIVFECASFLKTIIKGSLLCLVLEPTSSRATHLFHCEQSKGDPTEAKWWNGSGIEQKAKLECSLNGGAFESCAKLMLAEVTYLEAKALENV